MRGVWFGGLLGWVGEGEGFADFCLGWEVVLGWEMGTDAY